jgi:hypothetical protein
MYGLRIEFYESGDSAGYYFVKILMNSLYGKFGQRSGNEEIIGDCDPALFRVETELDLETGKRYRWRYIGGKILCRGEESESRYSHPAIAAHVTAYARCLLWELITVAGIENVHYMDTDSLHINAVALSRLASYLHSNRLGALKVEKTIDTAIYYGPKDYELDRKRIIKGVRADALTLDVGVFAQPQWVSLRGATMVEHSGAPLMRNVVKRFSRVYRKGNIGANNRTEPLRLALHDVVGRMK